MGRLLSLVAVLVVALSLVYWEIRREPRSPAPFVVESPSAGRGTPTDPEGPQRLPTPSESLEHASASGPRNEEPVVAGEAAWEEVRETFRDQLRISAETRAAHIGHLDPWPEAITPDWVREKIPRVKDASDARILDALDAVAHMTDRIQEEARGYMDLMDDRLLAQFDRGAFVRTQGSTEDVPLQEWEKGTSFFASSGAGQGWSYRISLTREAHPELVERRELLWELTDSREQAMRTMLR